MKYRLNPRGKNDTFQGWRRGGACGWFVRAQAGLSCCWSRPLARRVSCCRLRGVFVHKTRATVLISDSKRPGSLITVKKRYISGMARMGHLQAVYARNGARRRACLAAGVVLLLGECPADGCAEFSCTKHVLQCSSATVSVQVVSVLSKKRYNSEMAR